MAIHILKSHITSIIFLGVIAIGILAYLFPTNPYIGTLAEPITAFALYMIAIAVLFLPLFRKWKGWGSFTLFLVAVFVAWAAVWWFYVR